MRLGTNMIIYHRPPIAPLREPDLHGSGSTNEIRAVRIAQRAATAAASSEFPAQWEPKHAELGRLFADLREWREELDDHRGCHTPLEHLLFDRAVSSYERALSNLAPPLAAALADKSASLRPELLTLTSSNPDYALDDADVVLNALLGVPEGALASGHGQGFHPTPVRHLFIVLALMNLQPGDTVLDFGGGAGVTTVLGARLSPATWINVELDERLVRASRYAQSWAVGDSRATTVQVDFLSGELP
jgi:ribosomal protein L11 methylase PrmA